MSLGDKISNKAENLGGKAKHALGEATGDEQLQAEGKSDQLKAGLKDAVGDVADKVKGIFTKDTKD